LKNKEGASFAFRWIFANGFKYLSLSCRINSLKEPSIMLKNKLIFITGASSGIGAACAKHFAQAGARLLLCARRLNAVEQIAATLEKEYGVKTHCFELDVREPEQVRERLQALPEEWKKIDVLVNNAGLAAGLDPLQDGKVSDWEDMINTNLKGLLYVTREILPWMIARDSGHIINLGSVAGHQAYPKGAVYCATKAGVKSLSEGLRMDLSGTSLRVTSIDPGAVETQFSLVRFKGDNQRAASVYEGIEPLTPDDIAETIVFCASRPAHVNISEVLIMPTAQASATMMHRKAK
jgi:NADP-dependent 3-hydroxy acid dehydrogenase YdfG